MRKAAVQRVQKHGGTVESGALVKADNTKVNSERLMQRDRTFVLN